MCFRFLFGKFELLRIGFSVFLVPHLEKRRESLRMTRDSNMKYGIPPTSLFCILYFVLFVCYARRPNKIKNFRLRNIVDDDSSERSNHQTIITVVLHE